MITEFSNDEENKDKIIERSGQIQFSHNVKEVDPNYFWELLNNSNKDTESYVNDEPKNNSLKRESQTTSSTPQSSSLSEQSRQSFNPPLTSLTLPTPIAEETKNITNDELNLVQQEETILSHPIASSDTIIERTISEVSINPETQLESTEVVNNLTIVFAENLQIQENRELDFLDMYEIVDTALQNSYQYLSQFRFDPDYIEKWKTAFGEEFDQQIADELFNKFSESNFTDIPTMKIVNHQDIYGGNGAFSADTGLIYLTIEFLLENQRNSPRIIDVLWEEKGHFLDSKINEFDSPGDEGDIFSELVQGNTLTEEELQALKEENDIITIFDNQQNLQIEENGNTPLRIGTWNIGRDSAKPLSNKVTIRNHENRLQFISNYGALNQVDVVVIQEFNYRKFGDDLDTLKTYINSKYKFQYLTKEYAQNSTDNWYQTRPDPDSSGYLVLYDDNTVDLTSASLSFLNPDPATGFTTQDPNYTWQSEYWNRFDRTPINFQVEKGGQSYNFFSWHNEIGKRKQWNHASGHPPNNTIRPNLNTSLPYYTNPARQNLNIFNDQLSTNNAIILGDLNVSESMFRNTLTAWNYSRGINQNNDFIATKYRYNGWFIDIARRTRI